MGEKIRSALDQLEAELLATLGEERWAMVKPDQFELTQDEQVRLLGYGQFADQTREIAVNVFAHPGAEPTVSWIGSDRSYAGQVPLRLFLPGSSARFFDQPQGPPALLDRVRQRVAAEAAARLSNPAPQ